MKKAILIIILLVFVVAGFFGLRFYNKYYGNNVEKDGYVLIPHKANFKQILDSIAPYIKDRNLLKRWQKIKVLLPILKQDVIISKVGKEIQTLLI
jgi:UPF0755 protein